MSPTDEWVDDAAASGLRISFMDPPKLTKSPFFTPTPEMKEKATALRDEVHALLQKQATEVVTDVSAPGFYSRLFVVPKPGGRWRPVIDLSTLNRHIKAPRFQMETAQALRAFISPGDYAVSLDLRDAFLHVPVHRSARRYLKFGFEGVGFQFRT